jgi:hypothetical protein
VEARLLHGGFAPITYKEQDMPAPLNKPNKKIIPASELERPVKYPAIDIEVYDQAGDYLNADKAKELLGYEEVETLTDACCKELYSLTGIKAILHNNVKNRYLTLTNLLELKQEILNRRWRLNSAAMGIGKTGLTIDCQHRLVALIIARWEWEHPEKGEQWRAVWETEPVIPAVIMYGLDEDDALFATINKSKPGTIDETLYRSDHFKGLKSQQRKIASKVCGFAIKKLWERTGASIDTIHTVGGAGRLKGAMATNSEMLDFIVKHQGVIKAVSKIVEFDSGKDRKISDGVLTLGYSSALCYLMAVSGSDPEEYKVNRTEASLHLTEKSWKLAFEFWYNVANNSPAFKPLRKAIAESDHSADWKIAVIVKAWLCFKDAENLTPGRLKVEVEEDPDTMVTYMIETMPSVGGIDFGNSQEELERRQELADERAASPAEIEKNLKAEANALKAKIEESQRLEAERLENERKAAESAKVKKKPPAAAPTPAKALGAKADLNGEPLPSKITDKKSAAHK